jgi:hypothetical protein
MCSTSFTRFFDAVCAPMLFLWVGILFVNHINTYREAEKTLLTAPSTLENDKKASAFLLNNLKTDVGDQEQEVQVDIPEIDEFNTRKKDPLSSDLCPLVIQRTFFGASSILASEKLPVNPPPELS